MLDEALYIREMAKKHTELFRNSIPMIASENLLSPLAREMMVTDLHNRYAEGLPGARYYQGNEFVDLIELKAQELAKKLFRSEYADVRPISGTNANMGVLFALTKPGDRITVPGVSAGAHISSAKFGAVGFRGLEPVEYPFDVDEMNLDIDGTIRVIKETKPKLALFGQSVYLFPTPLKEFRDAFEEAGSHVWYDAAHVAGLIAGGKFQDPLREGVEVMTMSTHKTLPGPQHGMIVANPRDEKTKNKLIYGVFPGVLSNHHLNAMAALGVALAEHLKFGERYADQIIRNSKALGQALYERGFAVLAEKKGFTESHTLVVDVREHGGGKFASEALEKANIIVNKNLLPWDDVSTALDPSGLRLGTQELTRIGMKENDMQDVADFMKKVVIDKEEPAKVGAEVKAFKEGFQTVHYCFGEGTRMYDYEELANL